MSFLQYLKLVVQVVRSADADMWLCAYLAILAHALAAAALAVVVAPLVPLEPLDVWGWLVCATGTGAFLWTFFKYRRYEHD